MESKFSYICLTVEEKPRKNHNQENWPEWGSNPRTLEYSGGQEKEKRKKEMRLEYRKKKMGKVEEIEKCE